VVLIGRFASHYRPIPFAVGQFFVTGLLSLTVGFLTEWPFTQDAGLFTLTVLYTGIFSVGVAYTLQVWGQRFAPPTDAALILSLESVFAALSGWLMLGETLTSPQILGGLLILGGVVLSQADWVLNVRKEGMT
jgi:drug/metabolite transporter (DMT)-like permease